VISNQSAVNSKSKISAEIHLANDSSAANNAKNLATVVLATHNHENEQPA
jgi:hypothetical protein